MKIYRVHCRESDSWSGSSYFDVDFPTFNEADDFKKITNGKNVEPTAPDYYVQAESIEEITIADEVVEAARTAGNG